MNRKEIVGVLEELGAEHILAHSNNVQCSCLLARWTHPKGSDSRPSMGFEISPGGPSRVHCFACSYGANSTETFLNRLQALLQDEMDLDDLTYRVIEMEQYDPSKLAEVPSYEEHDTAHGEVIPEVYLERYAGQAHPYLLRRGFDIETFKAWEIGWDEEEKRVVFPVRRRDGKLVGAVGRTALKRGKPKYLNYWKFAKGMYLFGEHLVPSTPSPVVIVEGPIDALRVWQELRKEGIEDIHVVALFGAQPSRQQMDSIAEIADEAVLFLDNDDPGWACTTTLARGLQDRIMVTAVEYPDIGGDPDTLGAGVVKLIRERRIVRV